MFPVFRVSGPALAASYLMLTWSGEVSDAPATEGPPSRLPCEPAGKKGLGCCAERPPPRQQL